MVYRVTIDEAQADLPALIDAAVNGEVVLITRENDKVVQLVPVAPNQRGRPQFGSGKGLMVMADDFDEPLADIEKPPLCS